MSVTDFFFSVFLAAGGAVLVAALGVWAVFKMAFWVAKETGHSLLSSTDTPNKTDAQHKQVHPTR